MEIILNIGIYIDGKDIKNFQNCNVEEIHGFHKWVIFMRLFKVPYSDLGWFDMPLIIM